MVKSGLFRGAALAVLMSGVVLEQTAAAAEPPIGSRLGERTEKNKVEDERKAAHAAHELAGCIVVKRGSAARNLLNSRSDAEVKKLQSQMTGEVDCIANLTGNAFVQGVQVSYPTAIMRGDLAEELLERDRPAAARLQPLPIQRIYSRPWFAFTGRHVSVDEMATCLSDINPAAVMALVESAPFSDEENAAFGNLIPIMGSCLRVGTKLDAKREPLRAALAEALYQRMANPAEAAAAVAEADAKARDEARKEPPQAHATGQ